MNNVVLPLVLIVLLAGNDCPDGPRPCDMTLALCLCIIFGCCGSCSTPTV
ncbi:MAG: hypothetical protein GX095_07330 [Clostridiales bacterium]|jgi:hypothetical protein|nr:hypothetical protein [Clostridiales bacterium]HOB64714.1 hypothetical protein [Clostridia bacterium]